MSVAGQYKDSLFVTDILKILDTKPAIKQPETGIILDPSVTPEIEFQNVSFIYPNSDRMVLKNLSLKIRAGEKLALVGVNGSGKTTIVKLLCRFYDPTEGKILINGNDLRDIDLGSLYYLMGVLFQDFATYNFPVKQSIAMGRPTDDIDLEKVKNAAETSESDTFISQWSNGYDQMIGKEFTGGIDPSKGQMQKLALARTFYRDPKFLILDEPTASIDAEAEAKIFERLESLPADRTVILISHRFSTVRKADTICVINDGAISELGSHQELITLNGIYARLFNLQAAGYQN
jgi:ATP-binding cassette subfamily B protein